MIELLLGRLTPHAGRVRYGDRDMSGPLDAANVAMWVVEPLSPQRTKPAQQ